MKLNERRFLKLAGLLNEEEQAGAYTDKDGKRIVSVDVKNTDNKKVAKKVKYKHAPWWRFWNKNPDSVVTEYYTDSITTSQPIEVAVSLINAGAVTEQSKEELAGEIEAYVNRASPHLTPKVQKRGVFKIAGDKKYNYYILDDLVRAVAIFDKDGELKATKPFKIPAGSSLDTKVADKLRDGKKQGLSSVVSGGMAGIFSIDATKDQLKSKGKYLMNQMKSIYGLNSQEGLKLARIVATFNGVDANNPFKDKDSLKIPAINGVTALNENFYFNNRSIFDRPLLNESQLKFLEKYAGVERINEEVDVTKMDPSLAKLITSSSSGQGEDADGSDTAIEAEKMKAAIANLIPAQESGTLVGAYSVGGQVYTNEDRDMIYIVPDMDQAAEYKNLSREDSVDNPLMLMAKYDEEDKSAASKDLKSFIKSGDTWTPPSSFNMIRHELREGESLWVDPSEGDSSLNNDFYYGTSAKGYVGDADRGIIVKNFYASITGSAPSGGGEPPELNPFYDADQVDKHSSGVRVIINNDDYVAITLDFDEGTFPLDDLRTFAKKAQETHDSARGVGKMKKFFEDVNDAITTEGTVFTIDQDEDGVDIFNDLDDNDAEKGGSAAASLATDGSATFADFVTAFEQGVALKESRKRARRIDQSNISELRSAARRSLINLIK